MPLNELRRLVKLSVKAKAYQSRKQAHYRISIEWQFNPQLRIDDLEATRAGITKILRNLLRIEKVFSSRAYRFTDTNSASYRLHFQTSIGNVGELLEKEGILFGGDK